MDTCETAEKSKESQRKSTITRDGSQQINAKREVCFSEIFYQKLLNKRVVVFYIPLYSTT